MGFKWFFSGEMEIRDSLCDLGRMEIPRPQFHGMQFVATRGKLGFYKVGYLYSTFSSYSALWRFIVFIISRRFEKTAANTVYRSRRRALDDRFSATTSSLGTSCYLQQNIFCFHLVLFSLLNICIPSMSSSRNGLFAKYRAFSVLEQPSRHLLLFLFFLLFLTPAVFLFYYCQQKLEYFQCKLDIFEIRLNIFKIKTRAFQIKPFKFPTLHYTFRKEYNNFC